MRGTAHGCNPVRMLNCECSHLRFNIAGAKFLLPTGNVLFDFLTTDWYYPCLIVLCIPSTLVAVYLNW